MPEPPLGAVPPLPLAAAPESLPAIGPVVVPALAAFVPTLPPLGAAGVAPSDPVTRPASRTASDLVERDGEMDF